MNKKFEYIIESHINGQFTQVKELFKKLNRNWRKEYIKYCRDNGHTEISDYLLDLL